MIVTKIVYLVMNINGFGGGIAYKMVFWPFDTCSETVTPWVVNVIAQIAKINLVTLFITHITPQLPIS